LVKRCDSIFTMKFRIEIPKFHGIYPRSHCRTFKAGVTRIANQQWQEPPTKIWQRSFYDRIIRNEESLDAVRVYIDNNPVGWWG